VPSKLERESGGFVPTVTYQQAFFFNRRNSPLCDIESGIKESFRCAVGIKRETGGFVTTVA
jgi:hypothetical protein